MIALSVNYSIQLVPIIPLVANCLNTNKHLVLEQRLPPPSRLMSFLAYGIVQVVSSLLNLIEYSESLMYSEWYELPALFSLMLGYMILKLISTFTIGSSVSFLNGKQQENQWSSKLDECSNQRFPWIEERTTTSSVSDICHPDNFVSSNPFPGCFLELFWNVILSFVFDVRFGLYLIQTVMKALNPLFYDFSNVEQIKKRV